jgi:thiol-disulfide isomerase/thioredoxin
MNRLQLYTLIGVILFLALGGIYLEIYGGDDQARKEKTETSIELTDYGPAPEFVGIEQWLNSDPLTLGQLQGKVVLVDFWTYSCINCIRTLPYLTGWYEKYKDQGFVLVGVHTPEFAFEKNTENVKTAIKRHKINYPVAQDNNYGTWTAYNNRYWPAHYLIDQQGRIVYVHFGEGQYQETEATIQQLLGIEQEQEMVEENIRREVRTPEVYLGLRRLEFLTEEQSPSRFSQQYIFPKELPSNFFALEGQWLFDDESIKLAGNSGKLKLDFYAKDVHLVAESEQGAEIRILVDGQLVQTIQVKDSKLYTLFEGDISKARVLEIEIKGSGFRAFAFTFG